MPETRYIQQFNTQGELIGEVPYEVSDEELELEAITEAAAEIESAGGRAIYVFTGPSSDEKPTFPAAQDGYIFRETDTGFVFVSQGGEWTRVIENDPPSGKCRVTNLFVDPDTDRLIVEYDDTPVP